ncbi:MAG TPA: M14 family zinc carboxypeptidase [Candidatus Cloacimonas acidaminovorans]|nr:M14 family zinc carboxypeptidase [Candidatus Cloacimonas acidaminovorans]
MKIAMKIILCIMLFLPALISATLPTCYYNYAQIYALLQSHQQSHPDIAKIYTIGYSQQDHIPIYAIRISDNVEIDEYEPALLFVGQVHAEEVLGVQTTMANIAEILTYRYQQPYAQWISQLDLWFIPTLNPEGHNVVTENLDVSYRKNKRDNNNNGIFDFDPVTGGDIDGVDINRNFAFNWVHGDTLYCPVGDETYDYYRGPAPMSESEIIGFQQLCEQRKFIYAVCWHSSRTGNFSEKVYYPFNWKYIRPSPDLNFAASIATGFASQIIKQSGTGTYEAYPNLSRQGAFHDWLYQQYGTIALLVECGTSDIQPDSTVMVGTVQRCSNGIRWLINRALMFSSAVPSSSMLTGTVTAAGIPTEAEIIIQQHNAPWFRPRTSFPQNGKFYRPLASGSYTVIARKKGYYDKIINNQIVNNGSWTNIQINLEPKPPATLRIGVRCSSEPVSARVIIGDIFPDTLFVNGFANLNTYAGDYPIQIYALGYTPYIGTVNLTEGHNHLEFNLSPATIVFSEDWENGSSGWEIEGPWKVQNQIAASGYAITDSIGGYGFYAINCNVWIKTINPILIPATNQTWLIFDSHLYTEWNYDPCRVEISPDGNNWQEIWLKSGQWDSFRKEFVSLSDFAGQSIYLRFRLTDSSNDIDLTDPGWTLDNIMIVCGTATENSDLNNDLTLLTLLYKNYPNPFNPETTLSFTLAKNSRATLKIYNPKGQLVKTIVDTDLAKGDYRYVWNGKDNSGHPVASGVYLYSLVADGKTQTHKMLLLK